MKHLLYSIITGEIHKLYDYLRYETITFHINGIKYTISNEQLKECICCNHCKHYVFIDQPKVLIQNYIHSNYVYTNERMLKRRHLKRRLQKYLSKNHVHLTQKLWIWTVRVLLNDKHKQYRKLNLMKR